MSLRLRPLLIPGLVLLVACGDQFTEQPYCHTGCPLPHTNPPVVTWIRPQPGESLTVNYDLYVGVMDDKGVDHVDFLFEGQHITPSPIQAPPFTAEFGRYIDTVHINPGVITITAIGTDVEGNADTVDINVVSWKPHTAPPP